MSNVPAEDGGVAPNVRTAFYIGAAVLLVCVLWTVCSTSEYPPEPGDTKRKDGGFLEIFKDFGRMPKTMVQLGVVQFFSWFALFSMWVYMTPAVAEHCYGTVDRASAAYGNAGDWVGVLQGVYNGVAAVYAFLLPWIASKIGRKATHSMSLLLGALGFASFFIFKNPNMLVISMIGVGIQFLHNDSPGMQRPAGRSPGDARLRRSYRLCDGVLRPVSAYCRLLSASGGGQGRPGAAAFFRAARQDKVIL